MVTSDFRPIDLTGGRHTVFSFIYPCVTLVGEPLIQVCACGAMTGEHFNIARGKSMNKTKYGVAFLATTALALSVGAAGDLDHPEDFRLPPAASVSNSTRA
jgi:hypothetical protein